MNYIHCKGPGVNIDNGITLSESGPLGKFSRCSDVNLFIESLLPDRVFTALLLFEAPSGQLQ